MKLASLRDGSRDGRLVVVSRDVTQASDVRHIAPTLQAALDGWDRLAPHLDLVARGVESGGQPVERFHERDALAPLPRAYRMIVAGDDDAPGLRASDRMLAAREAVRLEAGAALAAGVAVVVGDVPGGADRATALAAIRLVLLTVVTSGGDASTEASALSPVAATPDALGAAWDGARLLGAIEANGRALVPDADAPDFGDLIVRAARFGPLGAGAIVGSAPLAVATDDIAPGGTLRIEMRDQAGHAIFGAFELVLEHAVPEGA